MSQSSTLPARERIMSPRYRWSTIGANALVFLAAFEAMAVTTIMPTIARDLRGEALYSAAFSVTLAASVIGMVLGGGWSDRRGPARPLILFVAIFVIGVLVSGTAVAMPVFIVGRFLQGLGMGAINVVLYVIVGRAYPPVLHPSIFALFSASWVVPSMVGPAIAGFVAKQWSWHWVFLGVGALVVVAMGAMVPTLRTLRGHGRAPDDPPPAPLGRTVPLAAVVAVAVVAVGAAGEAPPLLGWPVAAVAVAVIVVAVRPLLPPGTLVARRGLPATVLLRAAIAAAFFATEIYQPYILQARYGWDPTAAGLVLTVGAVAWSIGSQISGRTVERIPHPAALRIGAVLLLVGIATQALTAALHLHPAVIGAGWLLAGGGMGFMFTRINTLVLAYSTTADQGANGAAATIADSTGSSTSIALAGLLFLGLGGATSAGAFTGAFVYTTVVAGLALLVAVRVRERT